MSIPEDSDLELEIAHVLLIDVVGYSKLLVNGQIEVLQQLNRIVRETAHFRSAEAKGKLMRLPTGDGMALLFFDSAEAPVQCALEISEASKANPQMQLRMGAHSGPIKEVKDVNDRSNFAGAGINLAQRVLDCGDAGHILVSQRLAEDLRSYQHWHPWLHDLGECEVKHGVRLHLYNLCKDSLGNPAIPAAISRQRGRWQRWKKSTAHWLTVSPRRKPALAAAAIVVLGLMTFACWNAFHHAPQKSIAVLPFENASEDPNNVHFVNGVHGEVLSDLKLVPDLKVISSISVLPFKAGIDRDLPAIARTLGGVTHILQGSVQKVSDQVRVQVTLTDVATGTQLWAAGYTRELADVFAIQTEIAEKIVEQLKLQLSPEVRTAIEQRPTNSRDAYDLYTRAKGLIQDSVVSSARGKEDLTEAVQLLTKAVNTDPTFFLGYYQLARAHDQLYNRYDQTTARKEQAENAIQALHRLRPAAGETYLASAWHLYLTRQEKGPALAELEIAQRSLSNESDVPLLRAYIDRREGRWDESMRNFRHALDLDPQNPLILEQMSLSFCQLRRFPEMAEALRRAIDFDPSSLALRVQLAGVDLDWRGDTKPLHDVLERAVREDPTAAEKIADHWIDLAFYERDASAAMRALKHLTADGCAVEGIPFPRSWCEGMAARISGDDTAARAAFTKTRSEAEGLVRERPEDGGAACVLGMANAFLGKKDDAIGNGERAVKLTPTDKDALNGPLVAGCLAIIYAWTGEKELALDQLEQATKVPSYWSYGNLCLHPYWDPLRGDPRFEAIMESLAPK